MLSPRGCLGWFRRRAVAPALLRLYRRSRREELLPVLRRVLHIQLSAPQLRAITRQIDRRAEPSVLVFGLGNDSAFWQAANHRGRTAFLEDDPRWLDASTRSGPAPEAYAVEYPARLRDWQGLLGRDTALRMSLPREVADASWQVILVDGPHGVTDDHPGRMQSIFAAAGLVAPGGSVFVHDCDRPAERAFAERYLTLERRVEVVGNLWHFAFSATAAVPGPGE